jgi:hypothetical protein
MAVFNIWDSATNTELVNRALTTSMEDEDFIGPTLLPWSTSATGASSAGRSRSRPSGWLR